MLRGALFVGAIILVGTACGTDSNRSFESDYSEDGAWRDIAEKGCIEGMPTELHIEVDVDGETRSLDMMLEGNHRDLRGQMQVDDDVVELREWEPGELPVNVPPVEERMASLSGYRSGEGRPAYLVSFRIEAGRVVAVAVVVPGTPGARSVWGMNFWAGEFGTPGMVKAGDLSDTEAVLLRTSCL